jgi:hypothetical protein
MGAPPVLAVASVLIWGDVDCGGGVDPVDSRKLLRFDGGLDVDQEPGCTQIGSSIIITSPD